jgi:chorismate mutase / prephenate dehydratase
VKSSTVSVATIGGRETFAGQATEHLQRLYPELSDPIYYKNGAELFNALDTGVIDAIIGAAASLTGNGTAITNRLAERRLLPTYVIAEAQLPFGCSLLAKAGTRLADIKRVYGGPVSIHHGRPYLQEHLPRAEIDVYVEPMATAQSVATGDGTTAILGTTALAKAFLLEEIAVNIDGVDVNSNWWAISSKPLFDGAPTLLVVTGCFKGDGQVGKAIAALHRTGFGLMTMFARSTGQQLFECEYVLRLAGAGTLESVEEAMSTIPSARLAGALRVRTMPDARASRQQQP